MAPTFKNLIGGQWLPPATGRYLENRNPADTSDLIGRFPDSGPGDVDRAVAAASRAFERWKRVPAPARGDLLRRLGDLLLANKAALSDGMTREMGKVLKVLDYATYGGAPLLGVRGVTIICHGSSPPKAIRNAIRVAHQAVAVHLSTHIGEELAGEGAAR